jgi:hypothetical protein
MVNHIEIAVAPLKADAIARAEVEANKIIAFVREELAKHEHNMDKAAPYPKSYGSEKEYWVMKGKRELFYRLCDRRPESHNYNAPNLVDVSDKLVAKFIKDTQDDAALQYDMFVRKLVSKIGACDSAELSGNHVWGYSILDVKKGDKEEAWKTQQIVNTSKLGKLFNQWPTRKMGPRSK